MIDLFNLGEKYYKDGEAKDYAKAMLYYEKAANLGNAEGNYFYRSYVVL
jgi:TPR repeat protein